MAADIGADMGRPDLALRQLDRGEHRPLRAAGAEGRRPRRQRRRAPRRRPACAPHDLARARAIASASMPAGLRLGEERREAVEQHVRGVFAGLRQHVLAEHAGLDVGAAQLDVDRLLDVVGEAFLDDQHGALAGAELAHLLRHQRIGDVEHIDRHARSRRTGRRGRAAPARAARCCEAAQHDDADIVEVAREELVELVLADEVARGRQPLLDLEASPARR